MTDINGKPKYAISLGYFDGLHTGHKEVIQKTLECKVMGLIPAVILFDEHPKKVINNINVPMLLQKDLRDSFLEKMGLKIFRLSFLSVKDLSPAEFVNDILIKKLNAGAVSCGYNYKFGKNGAGDCSLLKKLCEEKGIKTYICEKYIIDNTAVSSTEIRKAIENADIEKANKMLGFEFRFSSNVFEGDKRGRLLGTPTINQFLPESLTIPAFGVYASKVYFDSKEYYAVTNIGSRPTFQGHSVRSETYIIDYSGNLYGKKIEVRLFKFLRSEQKFSDAISLKAQIDKDIKATKDYFHYT